MTAPNTTDAAPLDFALPTAGQRADHEQLLLELTRTPTAAGREERVVRYIRGWLADRDGLTMRADDAGNLVIEFADAAPASERTPLFITAHMDHPAFVVERSQSAGPDAGGNDGRHTLELSFRGGVFDPYFRDADIVVFTGDDRPVRARITSTKKPDVDPDYPANQRFARTCSASVNPDDAGVAADLRPGDIGRWDLPDASIEPDPRTGNRLLRTDACDDLAPLAAALAMMDMLRGNPDATHVRLLLTRAEEIGFVGAIAACKLGTMPPGSRTILLEASRAFSDSPVGGGPIVRVGDRESTFSPELTAGVSQLGELLSRVQQARDGETPMNSPIFPLAEVRAAAGRFDDSKESKQPAFRVQRKLMPGGVCESSAYLAYGYESTCVCLPLGNYHNMADLTAVVDEKDPDAIDNARAGREFVAVEDVHNLVLLLTAIGLSLRDPLPLTERLDRLYAQRERVLRGVTLFA